VIRSPFFTIVVPTYNRAHLLPRAIESILAQTFQDFEVIIVDDGSTDHTADVVSALGDDRIEYLSQENAGASAARNRGAAAASGSFLTFLDSDDEALPHWLEALHREIVRSGSDVVCCGLIRVGGGGEAGNEEVVTLPGSLGPSLEGVVGRFTNGGVFALRTDIFHRLGGYANDLHSGEHSELAMRLIPAAQKEGWRIDNVQEPLIRWHLHGGPRLSKDPEAKYAGGIYMLRKHPGIVPAGPTSPRGLSRRGRCKRRAYRSAPAVSPSPCTGSLDQSGQSDALGEVGLRDDTRTGATAMGTWVGRRRRFVTKSPGGRTTGGEPTVVQIASTKPLRSW
jgi:glycosyltransferase involved in cell wall biosynthesis